jgi:hypothetical protein
MFVLISFEPGSHHSSTPVTSAITHLSPQQTNMKDTRAPPTSTRINSSLRLSIHTTSHKPHPRTKTRAKPPIGPLQASNATPQKKHISDEAYQSITSKWGKRHPQPCPETALHQQKSKELKSEQKTATHAKDIKHMA